MPAYYHELIGQAADLQDAAGGWGGDFDDGTPESVKPSSAALDPAEVELFALKSSWDVVKACDRYAGRTAFPPLVFAEWFFVFSSPTRIHLRFRFVSKSSLSLSSIVLNPASHPPLFFLSAVARNTRTRERYGVPIFTPKWMRR